jgi:hypothetical protein
MIHKEKLYSIALVSMVMILILVSNAGAQTLVALNLTKIPNVSTYNDDQSVKIHLQCNQRRRSYSHIC